TGLPDIADAAVVGIDVGHAQHFPRGIPGRYTTILQLLDFQSSPCPARSGALGSTVAEQVPDLQRESVHRSCLGRVASPVHQAPGFQTRASVIPQKAAAGRAGSSPPDHRSSPTLGIVTYQSEGAMSPRPSRCGGAGL